MNPKPTELGWTSSDGGFLFARSWSTEGPSKAVLGIVHGLGEHSGRYQSVAEAFQTMGIGVVSYDQRGHGRTGGKLPSFETLSSDIPQLLVAMDAFGNAPKFLFGQSLGGGLVLHHAIATKPPVRGVIACSPLLATATEPPRWKLVLARLLRKLWPSFTLDSGINPRDLTHDPEEVQRYLNDPLVHHRISAALGWSMLQAGHWTLAHAGELSLPTLLMHGTQDRITSHAASRQFASDAGELCTLRLWEGLYHDLHFEFNRGEVLACIRDWISKLVLS